MEYNKIGSLPSSLAVENQPCFDEEFGMSDKVEGRTLSLLQDISM